MVKKNKNKEILDIQVDDETPFSVDDWFFQAYGVNLRIHKTKTYKTTWSGRHKIVNIHSILEFYDEESKTWEPLPVFEDQVFLDLQQEKKRDLAPVVG